MRTSCAHANIERVMDWLKRSRGDECRQAGLKGWSQQSEEECGCLRYRNKGTEEELFAVILQTVISPSVRLRCDRVQ